MSEMVFLNPLMISQAHAQGRQVFVYPGVFSQAWAYQWAMALGVDGLIVDDYLTLAEILGQ
jgi:glycerophosphoryl diester phosphodiesterase